MLGAGKGEGKIQGTVPARPCASVSRTRLCDDVCPMHWLSEDEGEQFLVALHVVRFPGIIQSACLSARW